MPAKALETLLEGERRVYDEIILDEAQDILRRSYLDVLDLSLRHGLAGGHWRFFGDFTWQRIYDAATLSVTEFLDPSAEARAEGAMPISAMHCALRVNCRNTPRVAALALACGRVTPGYRRVRRPDDNTEPDVRWFRDREEQLALLQATLTELRDDGFGPPRVAILSPYGNDRCAAAQITGSPWRDRLAPLVAEPDDDAGDGEEACDWLAAGLPCDLDAVDLRSGRIKYSSIYRFKGLEAPAVVITDIEALDPAQRALLYVGCMRALHRLVILADRRLRGQLPG